MHSASTQPLTASDRAAGRCVRQRFRGRPAGRQQRQLRTDGAGRSSRPATRSTHDHGPLSLPPRRGNTWINFNNMADWGTAYLDRDATTAYVFLGNSAATSRYWDAFTDHIGHPLDTGIFPFYTMTFTKAQLPDAKRFWSVTAYIGRPCTSRPDRPTTATATSPATRPGCARTRTARSRSSSGPTGRRSWRSCRTGCSYHRIPRSRWSYGPTAPRATPHPASPTSHRHSSRSVSCNPQAPPPRLIPSISTLAEIEEVCVVLHPRVEPTEIRPFGIR